MQSRSIRQTAGASLGSRGGVLPRLASLVLMTAVTVGAATAQPIRAATLVVLGDSLSAGYGLAEDESWVSRLETELARVRPDLELVNASISGATTAAGLQQLPVLLERYRPAYVLLELGANDGLQGKPLPVLTRNLRSLITSAREAGAEVVLFGMQLPPNFGRRYTQAFSAIFADLADEYRLPYVPFLLEDVALSPELMQSDGLHPTASAQEPIFATAWQVLGPVLKSDSAAAATAGASAAPTD